MKNILVKAEQEEYKYKELHDKMVEDSKVYFTFIKRLQDENEQLYQRLNKAKKLLRSHKVKFNEDDHLEKEPYTILRQYMEKEIVANVNKVLIPQMQSKLQEKIGIVENSLNAKYKKLLQVKHAVQSKPRRQ